MKRVGPPVMRAQQGLALPIVLVLLTLGVMLGVSGLHMALTAERLAGNLGLAAQARMSAEATAVEALDALDAPADMQPQPDAVELESLTWQVASDPTRFAGQAPFTTDCPPPLRCLYRYLESPSQHQRILAMSAVVNDSGGVEVMSRPVVVEVAFSRLAERLIQFTALAGGEIDGVAQASGAGRVQGNATAPPSARVSLPPLETTPPADAERLSVLTDAQGRPYCRFVASGDLAGQVYHCAGRLEVDALAPWHHATLMAEGDIRLDGELGGEAPLDVAVLAGGDIRLGSGARARAWLLAAGGVWLAPGSRLEGAVLAHGDIRLEGQLLHRLGQPRLPHVTPSARLVSWQ